MLIFKDDRKTGTGVWYLIGTGITSSHWPISPIGLNRVHFKGHAGSISESMYPSSGTAGLLDKDDDNSVPQLYLNILYFDKDMNFITGDYDRGTVASNSDFEQLELEVLVPMEGYMLIYVSNEEEQAHIAYFDDISITHNHSPVIQENAYYPFGLQHASSYQRSYSTKQAYKYQGKVELPEIGVGMYDFHARMYDATLGRTFQLDPMADNFEAYSPYSWVLNNPLTMIDPTGMVTLRGDFARMAFESIRNMYGGGGSSSADNNNSGGCGENGQPCPDDVDAGQQEANDLLPDGVNPYMEVVPGPMNETNFVSSNGNSYNMFSYFPGGSLFWTTQMGKDIKSRFLGDHQPAGVISMTSGKGGDGSSTTSDYSEIIVDPITNVPADKWSAIGVFSLYKRATKYLGIDGARWPIVEVRGDTSFYGHYDYGSFNVGDTLHIISRDLITGVNDTTKQYNDGKGYWPN